MHPATDFFFRGTDATAKLAEPGGSPRYWSFFCGPAISAQLACFVTIARNSSTASGLRLGIFTALDLPPKDQAFLRMHFGKAGLHYHNIC
jgi:hypothetical protein